MADDFVTVTFTCPICGAEDVRADVHNLPRGWKPTPEWAPREIRSVHPCADISRFRWAAEQTAAELTNG